ncbi:MAG: Gfo/Idh/MocA family oxidoreductase [Planctomycetota bacterium]|jgi:predicted dehydrogenase|nr:Gfo/Idh/MocA family oxidoreductase [Planctomycetota bacterium]
MPKLTRRKFLKNSAITAAVTPTAAHLLGSCTLPPRFAQGKLRHAAIGVGGMGGADLKQISSHPDVEVIALCDVDENFLNEAAKLHPQARLYCDWRKMLEKEHQNLDSVNVTTPDHMHAPISLKAIELRLHVYCQKPLTHTVHESRQLNEIAKRKNVVTQMGIQNHSGANYSIAHKLFAQDHIKDIHEVHVWTDRPAGWWPQGVGRPEGEDPIPAHLDWDKWLGVAPQRPYKDGLYHAFAWRGRLDFGTGAQGDMACHLMDPAIWFLELGHPNTIKSHGPPPTDDTFPLESKIEYQFPATSKTSPNGVKVVWHDGKNKPDALLNKYGFGENPYANASLFIGSNGAHMFSPYEIPKTTFNDKLVDLALPEATPCNHWHQWVDACFGRTSASAPFEYSAHLTEIALLGNIALNFPNQTLSWQGKRFKFENNAAATALLSKDYREGWRYKGLA